MAAEHRVVCAAAGYSSGTTWGSSFTRGGPLQLQYAPLMQPLPGTTAPFGSRGGTAARAQQPGPQARRCPCSAVHPNYLKSSHYTRALLLIPYLPVTQDAMHSLGADCMYKLMSCSLLSPTPDGSACHPAAGLTFWQPALHRSLQPHNLLQLILPSRMALLAGSHHALHKWFAAKSSVSGPGLCCLAGR